MIVDANGLILGRLASNVAKRLIDGEEIIIVNAEKAIISGSKVNVLKEYKEMREKGSKEKGPYFPRMPDKILKRTIRGMLPYKKKRGAEALSRLRVYIGVPDEYKNLLAADYTKRRLGGRYVRLGEVSERLGAKF
jgi:large subunit ribosomal protein L13